MNLQYKNKSLQLMGHEQVHLSTKHLPKHIHTYKQNIRIKYIQSIIKHLHQNHEYITILTRSKSLRIYTAITLCWQTQQLHKISWRWHINHRSKNQILSCSVGAYVRGWNWLSLFFNLWKRMRYLSIGYEWSDIYLILAIGCKL